MINARFFLAIPALDVTQKSDQPNTSTFFSVESFSWFPGFSPIILEVLTLTLYVWHEVHEKE